MKSIKPKNNQTGFTLIELLFATVLLGIMLTIAISTFIGVFRFYVWAGTTRDNQASSRQLMDDISRNIASRKINSVEDLNGDPSTFEAICLDQAAGSTDGPIKIYLDEGTKLVKIQKYLANPSCTSPLLGNSQTISNTNMKVSVLKFNIIYGAYNHSEPPDFVYKKSAVIDMTVTNGNVDVSGECNPTDNFCDQAKFTTAVSER